MPEELFDLIVIGAGPGGYTAALRAVGHGMKTLCVERDERPGGVCLNRGCIPSKALLDSSHRFAQLKGGLSEHGIGVGDLSLDLGVMMARKEKVVADLTGQLSQLLRQKKVDMRQGTAVLAGNGQVRITSADGAETVVTGRRILLATGGEPMSLPNLPFDGERVLTSTEALCLARVPETLGIVGAGYIGLEMASVWSRLGAKVTVIEAQPRICPTLDSLVSRRLERVLRKQGIVLELKVNVTGAEVNGAGVTVTLDKGGQSESLVFERLLVAVGRHPLTAGLGLESAGVETDPHTGHVRINARFETTASGIFAIGDLVAGPALAHKASAEAMAAVDLMAGRWGEVNYDAIPSVIYTWPEAAAVGITEDQAKERGIPVKTANFPFSGNGRARCMGETDGFVKFVVHAETDRLLGVHLIGPEVSELVAECTLAMTLGASAEDISRTIHAHPTLAEAILETAHAV